MQVNNKKRFLKYTKKLSYDDSYVYSGEHIIGKIDWEAKTLQGNGGDSPLAWCNLTMKHKRYVVEQLGLTYIRSQLVTINQYGQTIVTYVGK